MVMEAEAQHHELQNSKNGRMVVEVQQVLFLV